MSRYPSQFECSWAERVLFSWGRSALLFQAGLQRFRQGPPVWGGPPALLKALIQMWIPPRSTLTGNPGEFLTKRVIMSQFSRGKSTWPSLVDIKLTNIMTSATSSFRGQQQFQSTWLARGDLVAKVALGFWSPKPTALLSQQAIWRRGAGCANGLWGPLQLSGWDQLCWRRASSAEGWETLARTKNCRPWRCMWGFKGCFHHLTMEVVGVYQGDWRP